MTPLQASAPIAASVATAASSANLVFSPDALMNGGATLVGAFFGAMAAFLFQLVFQRRQDRKAELLGAHRVLFCLLQQTNAIVLVQRDFIAPHINSKVRFLEIPAVQDFDVAKNLFDFSTFGFLLKSKKGRAVMYDLYMAQESYVETIRLLNDRSRLHRQELQPKMAAAGIGSGRPVNMQHIAETLGPLLFKSMNATTEQLLELMVSTFQKLTSAKTVFRTFVVQDFRSDDFADFDFPATFGLVKDSPSTGQATHPK